MNRKWQLILALVAAGACSGRAALILSGNSYVQNFDAVGDGLPTGWSVYTGSTSSSLGSSANFTSSSTYWSKTSGGFYNIASADGLNPDSSTADQNNSTDRALGVRQVDPSTTPGFDPGAAIVLQIQNTAGYANFNLSLEAQVLSEQTRSTTWLVQYRIGDSGSFTTLSTFGDPSAWGSTMIVLNSGDLRAWDDQPSDIWFRIAALDPSTGSGSRDMFAVDDFSLGYSAVPESDWSGLMASAALLAFCGFHLWRQYRLQALTTRQPR